jgi:hypothetical protein
VIQIRPFEESDVPALEQAISRDAFHPAGTWKTEHFTGEKPAKVVSVIEDSHGPITFVRYTKTLRITCVWNDGEDNHRNARAIILGIKDAVERARASGFTEIIVETESDKLATFFERVLKMSKSGSEYTLQV